MDTITAVVPLRWLKLPGKICFCGCLFLRNYTFTLRKGAKCTVDFPIFTDNVKSNKNPWLSHKIMGLSNYATVMSLVFTVFHTELPKPLLQKRNATKAENFDRLTK